MNADNITPTLFQKFVYKPLKFQNTLYVSLEVGRKLFELVC